MKEQLAALQDKIDSEIKARAAKLKVCSSRNFSHVLNSSCLQAHDLAMEAKEHSLGSRIKVSSQALPRFDLALSQILNARSKATDNLLSQRLKAVTFAKQQVKLDQKSLLSVMPQPLVRSRGLQRRFVILRSSLLRPRSWQIISRRSTPVAKKGCISPELRTT